MKKKILLLTLLPVFVIAFAWAQDNGGILTVNNCPDETTALICVDGNPATMMELLGAISKYVAGGSVEGSSCELYTTSGDKFSETGVFLVLLINGSDVYFLANVKFNNGGAAIDFKRMTAQSSLPVS